VSPVPPPAPSSQPIVLLTDLAFDGRGAIVDAPRLAIVRGLGGNDQARATRIADLMRRSDAVIGNLDGVNATIDEIVEVALTEVRDSVAHEKAELASYRREFLLYEAESRALGGTVLGNAFRDVKSKFYEVLVRSDVGIVDVNWSQKEESDDDLQRLNLDKSREIKQLKDEFADLIREARDEQAVEKKPAPAPTPPAAPEGGAP